MPSLKHNSLSPGFCPSFSLFSLRPRPVGARQVPELRGLDGWGREIGAESGSSARSAFHPLPFPPPPSAWAPLGGDSTSEGISIASEEIAKGLFNCSIKV